MLKWMNFAHIIVRRRLDYGIQMRIWIQMGMDESSDVLVLKNNYFIQKNV